MPEINRGSSKPLKSVNPRGYRKKAIPERVHEEPEPRQIRPGPERDRGPEEQGPATDPANTEEPEPGSKPVTFTSYTPLDTSKLPNVKVPVDPSGGGGDRVVCMTGNVWLAVSADDGATFTYLDPTTMFPKFAGGIVGDQQLIYIPEIRRFAWVMLHNPVPSSGDGAFRIAFASPEDVAAKPKTAWGYVDFLGADIGVTGAFLDQPHLAFSGRFLIVAIDASGKGRVVIRIPQSDIVGGQIGWEYTDPLTVADNDYQFSAPAGGGPPGVFMAGHIDTSTLRIVEWLDGANAVNTHDVAVGKWSDSGDYSCTTPSGLDWSGRCSSRISGATWRDGQVWFSWMSPRSNPADQPFYPQPYTRVVAIHEATFHNDQEMQVWNPDYAFAYSSLAVSSQGEIAISVGWGGPKNEADAAFGILGDFVVWYRDGSTATAGSDGAGRWGDFLRTHRAAEAPGQLDGFGYFTTKNAAGAVQQDPYHVRYGR